MRAEKIKAILGVPMKVSGRLIGIVFAADRVERVFTAEEVELLSSLATLAALAIEKAKLLDQTQRALVDVETAHSKALEQQQALDRAAAAHELFTQIILGGGGLDDLVSAVFDVLEVPGVIVGPWRNGPRLDRRPGGTGSPEDPAREGVGRPGGRLGTRADRCAQRQPRRAPPASSTTALGRQQTHRRACRDGGRSPAVLVEDPNRGGAAVTDRTRTRAVVVAEPAGSHAHLSGVGSCGERPGSSAADRIGR
ncbi:GAF domain-containing protein [Pseudonocardia kujensis]|uniref:GAF domain-containing protein n=1 Tax=Pseudonocardia kujensis TaxID=1128675 RepID=UPI001E431D62|nr:GAF domain-containing protein [Pseudonocardia kujensis]MCE0764573.1 GAF domain-containing protein [Pseudonocardia kujensis]